MLFLIKKNIKNIKDNYGLSDKEAAQFYWNDPKTTDLIKFIINRYQKYFPTLNAYSAYQLLKNQTDEIAVGNPIFMLMHDLIHQVIEPKFIENLETQDDIKSLLDELNEDLASILSNFQPIPRVSQGLFSYIENIFYEKFDTRLKQDIERPSVIPAEEIEIYLKSTIEKTFAHIKLELRNKINKLETKPERMARIKLNPGFDRKIKQLVDGFLSRIKHSMMSQVAGIVANLHNKFRPQDKIKQIGVIKSKYKIWEQFDLGYLMEEWYDKLKESSILPQTESSALSQWLRECLSKMDEVANYFENSYDEEYEEIE